MNQVTELIRPTEQITTILFFFLFTWFLYYIRFYLRPIVTSLNGPLNMIFSCLWVLGFFLSSQLYPQPQRLPFVTLFLSLVDSFILLMASTWCMYPSVSPGTTFSGRQMQRCHQRTHGTRYSVRNREDVCVSVCVYVQYVCESLGYSSLWRWQLLIMLVWICRASAYANRQVLCRFLQDGFFQAQKGGKRATCDCEDSSKVAEWTFMAMHQWSSILTEREKSAVSSVIYLFLKVSLSSNIWQKHTGIQHEQETCWTRDIYI